jgi:hypothetical protein
VNWTRLTAALLSAALLPGAPAIAAQQPLSCGNEIRVNGVEGWLAAAAPESVVVRSYAGRRYAVASAEVTDIAIVRSRGTHMGKGMGLGTLIGGAAGAIIGASVVESDAFLGPAGGALAGFIIGAPTGFVVGMSVGALRPARRWASLPETTLADYARDRPRCGPIVRARRGRERIEGVMVAANADSLTLAPRGGRPPVTVPMTDMPRIERPAGTRGHVAIGAVAGLLVGGVAGNALANTTKEYTGFVVAGGVALGSVVGLLARTPRWERTTPDALEIGLVPRHRGVSVTVALRF